MVRLFVFIVLVLGLPSVAFLALGPRTAAEAGPAMLVFLLTPACAGWLLSRGLPTAPIADRKPLWPAIGLALALSLLLAAIGAGGALLGGALVGGGALLIPGAAGGVVSGAVTSTMEELGWSAGGTLLARRALGPRWGIVALGSVWAAWHLLVALLAPAEIVAGMFGRPDPFSFGQTASFVLACLVYRFVLVSYRDRADRVWPAVVGHAAPNMVFGALIGSGWARFDTDASWVSFPGPTGIPFLIAATAIAIALNLHRPRS